MQNIRVEFDLYINQLAKVLRAFAWEDKYKYAIWLKNHYYLVQHTTRFLSLGAARTDVNNKEKFKHWTHHLAEETGHEEILIRDMKALANFDYDVIPKLPEVNALIALQYQVIDRGGPEAHFGYSFCLEGLAVKVCDELSERVTRAHNEQSSQFLKLHGIVDTDHFAAAMNYMETIDEKYIADIRENLITSTRLYAHLMHHIEEISERLIPKLTSMRSRQNRQEVTPNL